MVEMVSQRGEAVRVRVEVVRTPAARARGLMFRSQLDQDQGMLFVMDREEVQSFWMKNTYLPLDMIFIGTDLRVRGVVANTRPLSEDSCQVDAPSLYVLEVNAGFAAAHAIAAGAKVRLVGVVGVEGALDLPSAGP